MSCCTHHGDVIKLLSQRNERNYGGHAVNVIFGIVLALATLLGQPFTGHVTSVEKSGVHGMYIQRTPCDNVDWEARDVDGRKFTPFDANGDGFIDCTSDVELGA
jgi:hypothetical protein